MVNINHNQTYIKDQNIYYILFILVIFTQYELINQTWISTRILCFLVLDQAQHWLWFCFVLVSIWLFGPLLVVCVEDLRWWWHGHELFLIKVKQSINLYCGKSTSTNTFFQSVDIFSLLYCKLPCWSWKQIEAHLLNETGIRFYLKIKLH